MILRLQSSNFTPVSARRHIRLFGKSVLAVFTHQVSTSKPSLEEPWKATTEQIKEELSRVVESKDVIQRTDDEQVLYIPGHMQTARRQADSLTPPLLSISSPTITNYTRISPHAVLRLPSYGLQYSRLTKTGGSGRVLGMSNAQFTLRGAGTYAPFSMRVWH
ncbi:hypothetical protein C8R42DRAFT_637373 [Lentinula raphanica]|nr:hypothetical protein C8R42DRAFT_637373 [Lentinula raphanica]